MKIKRFLFLAVSFYIPFSFAQNPLVKQWDQGFGGTNEDHLHCIQQTTDAGFILGGYSVSGISGNKTQSLKGGKDYWIVKTDSYGNKLWDKDFGGNYNDEFRCVKQTKDGGYISGGFSASGISGDKTQPSWGFNDFWIVKTDSLGNIEWDKNFGGAGEDQLFSLQQTSDGGFILAGQSASGVSGNKTQATHGQWDYWIVKTDSVGNKQWDRDFGTTAWDQLYAVEQTFDGGYILGGVSFSGVNGDKATASWGGADFWIIKTDALGNMQWEKDFGGSDDDYLISLLQTNDGGFIFAGQSASDAGGDKTQNNCLPNGNSHDYWIIKTDSLGNKQWDKDYGGILDEECYQISSTNDHGFILSGTSYSGIGCDKSENNLGPEQAWIIKTDSLGIRQWDKTLFTNSTADDEMGLAVQTNDGCYLMAGFTDGGAGGDKSQNSFGAYDYWIIKFCDTTQIITNVVNLASSDTNFCDKQYIDFYDLSTNNPTSWQWLFPGGSPSSSTLQNPTGIYYNSYGSFDVTLIACNASGCDTLYLPNFIHEFQSPPVPVITWSADTLYSTPAFSYQWYFNSSIIPGASGQYYVFQQPGDYFVIITDSNGCATPSNVLYTGIEEANTNMGIYVIPNPTQGDFNLYGAPVNAMAKIYDLTGRLLYSCKIKSSPQKINFKATDGLYNLEISKSEMLVKKKILIKN